MKPSRQGILYGTIGWAARNAEARVVLYADTVTGSMERAMEETQRRRERQIAFNEEHGFTPKTVYSGVKDVLEGVTSGPGKGKGRGAANKRRRVTAELAEEGADYLAAGGNLAAVIDGLEKDMREAAANLEFEEAARLRDEVKRLREGELGL